MYNEKIEKLIELALADGELTEQEKQVLFRKAAEEGIDLDEFEMVLNGRLHLTQQESKPTDTKSDKHGDIRKCPSCGAIVPAMKIACPDCGHEFSNIKSNASIHRLMQMLDEVESKREDQSALSVMLDPFVLGGTQDKTNNRKKELIQNFPIPNTKEDIIEFLAMAASRTETRGNNFTNGLNTLSAKRNRVNNEFAEVWKIKCKQVIMKAKILLNDDPRGLEEIEGYAKSIGVSVSIAKEQDTSGFFYKVSNFLNKATSILSKSIKTIILIGVVIWFIFMLRIIF